MNFIFNDFKRRFLNGEVPAEDTWTFIPVSDDFKNTFETGDYKLEQYRTLYDFKDVSDLSSSNKITFDFIDAPTASNGKGKLKFVDVNNVNFKLRGTGLLEGKKVTHIWSKVIDDESFNVKPMYITENNYEDFLGFYSNTVADNQYIDLYVKKGFYFIRSKEELEWFAERSKTNSTIIGVIGDNIEGVIDKPIGPDDTNPFNGILDGNYFSLDITIQAKNSDNGIVGVLGPQGVIRNVKLIHTDKNKDKNSIECELPISLKYIKQNGRDINCGLLVGRNYGYIENIDASELKTFNLYGFVPSVYSVTNKSDKYYWYEDLNFVRSKYDDQNENYYFCNSFCINSPGNICPYVGYFAEGKFADDAAAVCLDTNSPNFTGSTITSRNSYFMNLHVQTGDFKAFDISADSNGFEYNPLGLYLYNDKTNNNILTATFISDSSLANADYYVKSPLYYGLDFKGYWTTRNIGPQVGEGINASKSIICYNANLIKDVWKENVSSISEPSYEMTRCSMRMHPQARAAYNIGTIIGANYGTAIKIDVSAVVKNTSNFVGFIGGLAGKQSEGYIDLVNVSIDNQFNYELGNNPASGGVVYYKQTPILPPITNILLNKINFDTEEDKLAVIQKYFSAWYDNGAIQDDSPVNTAQTITNDVITYQLKPIFVVGGLFGRYIPSYNVDKNALVSSGCFVNNTNVIYHDNYADPTGRGIIKSKENSFGALVGKVDYDVKTNTVLYTPSLYCYNSNFYCKEYTGEPFTVYPTTSIGTSAYPIMEEIGYNIYRCASAVVPNKFVGIYELKNNILDSVVYNAYNEGPTGDSQRKLSAYKIFDICDYPIDLASHEGGILQTHNFTNWMQNGITAVGQYNSIYYPMYYQSPLYPENPVGYDHWHQFFNYPNISHPSTSGIAYNDPAGWNKRNMASKLIFFSGCNSNVCNYIQVYDDYLNTWNQNKIPKIYNVFDKATDAYAISRWWTYYNTNSQGACVNSPIQSSADACWDNNVGGNYTAYSGWFALGFNQHNINAYLLQGIQNTFDGYTTVDFNANSQIQYWYDLSGGIADRFNRLNNEMCENPATIPNYFKPNEVNCLQYLTNTATNEQELYYLTNRVYRKNISIMYNYNLHYDVINTFNMPNKVSTFFVRNNDDTYFYYSYDNKLGVTNAIKTNYNTLENAFAFKEKVKYDSILNCMGYFSYVPEYENDNETTEMKSYRIELGEYYTPIQIRTKLSNYTGEGIPTFETTSISSKNNFAGLLVVDSSGRNVMYYDNENASQLTGNSVYFPCYIYPERKEKLLLEIK